MTRKKVHLDSTGQPGGPSHEEQARVDAEQIALMAELKQRRDEENEAERANHEAKLERARVAVQRRADLETTVAELVKRVSDLEKKAG